MAMDAKEAREHLEMVDRILERAQPPRTFRPYARLLVAFGIAAAVSDVGGQLELNGHGFGVAYAGVVLLIVGYAYAIWLLVAARRNAARVPASEARMGRVFGAVWVGVFGAAFAQPHVFAGWGGAAIWNLGAVIQMFMVGFSGDRRALAAGGVLLASLVAANYLPPAITGYVLAAGFVFGYLLPGIVYLVQNDGCENA